MPGDDDEQDDRELDRHDDGVHAARDLHAEAQQAGDREHEQRGDEVVVRAVDPRRQADAERVLADDAEVVRPARRDGRGAERQLEDEVPADDPRDELADARVGERVRGAGDRHRRGELRVAQRREPARDPGGDERQRDRRAGQRAGGLAGQDEDARADDDADAEDDEIERPERAAQAVVLVLRVRDRLVDRLRPKQCPSRHGAAHTRFVDASSARPLDLAGSVARMRSGRPDDRDARRDRGWQSCSSPSRGRRTSPRRSRSRRPRSTRRPR